MLAEVIIGSTGIGNRRSFRTVEVGLRKFSVEKLKFSALLEVCTVDLVPKNSEIFSETGVVEGKVY